jgi:hypothetical protein
MKWNLPTSSELHARLAIGSDINDPRQCRNDRALFISLGSPPARRLAGSNSVPNMRPSARPRPSRRATCCDGKGVEGPVQTNDLVNDKIASHDLERGVAEPNS